ncbi:MAG: EamA family transporter [Pacificimonas sp.]|jgi:drug/metabolite transporter (DMT)-like permease|nr:EamA family transporter [Pacificimonas sp.]
MEPRHLVMLGIPTLVWGTTWYVIKTQIGLVPVEWSVAYRFILASAVMFAIAAVRGRTLRFPPRAHLFFLGVGVFQFFGNFNFVYQASEIVTSGLIAVAFALLIVPNAFLAWLFFGQRVSRRFMVGAALGIVGVALLFRQEIAALSGTSDLAWGLSMTVLAVLAASVANVMQAAPSAQGYPMTSLLAWAMLYGAGLDIAAAWATAGPPVFDPSALYVGGVIYLSLFASALAFVLYFSAIREIGPAVAAYSGVLVPLVAMLISTAIEGYRWTGPATVGAVLTLLGLVIAFSARRKPAPPT